MSIISESSFDVDPDDVDTAHCLRLIDYWQSRCDGPARPCWRDLDLMDIYDVAPFLVVKDVIDGGQEFRNRYFGTAMTEILGYDGTNFTLADRVDGRELEYLRAVCTAVVEAGKPVRSRGRVFWAKNKEHLRYACIYLPLDDTPGNLAHLITAFDFLSSE